MVIYTATQYLLIDFCFGVLFKGIVKNFAVMRNNDKFISLTKDIYDIFSKIQQSKGNSVISFDDFCNEQYVIFSGLAETDKIRFLEMQLRTLKKNYPQFS